MAKMDKHDLIIESALRVFCDKGYANTRMADIAKRAGVSYGLVYHYFGSKEVLFDVIVESWWDNLYEMLERQKAAEAEGDFEQVLRGIITFFIEAYVNKPDLVTIFVTEVSRSSVYHTAKGLARFRKTFELLESIMASGQKMKFLRADIGPHYLTYIFFGAIESFISIMVLGNEPVTLDRQVRTMNGILSVFLHGAKA